MEPRVQHPVGAEGADLSSRRPPKSVRRVTAVTAVTRRVDDTLAPRCAHTASARATVQRALKRAHTLTSMSNLAVLLYRKGLIEEATLRMEEVLQELVSWISGRPETWK